MTTRSELYQNGKIYKQIKETIKQYREANKEKIKMQKKKYYEANKEKIKMQNKEKNKRYYEANKEKRKMQMKQYNKDNKEKIKQKQSEKITCECGSVVRRCGLIRHKKTKKHIRNIKV